jgi:AraC-like DNA-binding protein
VSTYREHAPPAELAPWLECIWERRGEPGPPVRVLPDGCIDVLWLESEGTCLVGPNTTAFLTQPALGAHVVGARFHPGAAPALLGVSAEELLDARVPFPLPLDCPPDAGRLARLLVDRLGGASLPDPLVQETTRRLTRPRVEIAALATDLGVSERQLRRRVTEAVGYGPKRLARVLRLLRAVDEARSGGELARVALDAGYADQAHFAHECRELAGVSPSRLIAAA